MKNLAKRFTYHPLIEPAGTATATVTAAAGFLMFIALPLLWFMNVALAT